MRGVVALLLLGAALFAQTARLLPPGVYADNRAIVDAIARKGGGLATQLELLERAGVLREAFEAPGGGVIRLRAAERPLLFLHLTDGALQSAGLYTSHMADLAYGSSGLIQTYRFRPQDDPRLSKLVDYFERHGAQVRRMVFEGGWVVDLDLSAARPDARRLEGSATLQVPKDGVWLDVCGAAQVRLASVGGGWYPKIFIYDRDLEPLDRHIAESAVRTITLSLPNGACYIKIADRFTHKNLKRGLKAAVR